MKFNFWRFRDFKKGIKNIFYYLPTIWRDRDWDHGYMEELMLVKLEKWYKEYSSPNLIMSYIGIEKDLQAMRICINILKRRKENFYTDIWHSHPLHQKVKYGSKPFVDEKTGELLYEWISYGLTEEEEKEHGVILKNSNKIEKRDWRIFCRIFEKYFEKWWD